MAKEKKDAASIVDAPAPAPAPTKYTKLWAVECPAYGSRRVFGDTKDEAVEEYRRVRCPNVGVEVLLPQLVIIEIPFTPADTEKDKPYGWVKPAKGKSKVKLGGVDN